MPEQVIGPGLTLVENMFSFESEWVTVVTPADTLLSWLAEHDDKLAEAGSQYRGVRRG